MSRDFRSEARSVREAAKAKLSELRAIRRNKRASNAPTDPEPTCERSDDEPEASPDRQERADATDAVVRETPETFPKSPEAVSASLGLRVSAASQCLSRIVTEGKSEALCAEGALQQSTPIPPATPEHVDPAHEPTRLAQDPEPDNPAQPPALLDTDLKTLPGVGDGLVRLLNACEVRSLKDLSNADPETLRKRMGLPGELLDLDALISVAKDSG